MKAGIIVAIILINLYFLYVFISDLRKNHAVIFHSPGNSILILVYTLLLYFFGTFGIPDFAISSSVFLKTGWVREEDLPGTLNTESVIPVAVMAICYISFVDVAILTLIVPIAAQILGAWVSPQFVMKLDRKKVRICVMFGLFTASLMLLLSLLGIAPNAGNLFELHGWRLVLCGVIGFLGGVLNNLGIGSFSVMLAFLYCLGLSNLAAYPIMMGACAMSVPLGSTQFIRAGRYSRKITLFSSVFGSAGVMLAICLVKSLNAVVLKWVVLGICLYTAISLLLSLRK